MVFSFYCYCLRGSGIICGFKTYGLFQVVRPRKKQVRVQSTYALVKSLLGLWGGPHYKVGLPRNHRKMLISPG